MRSLRVRHKTYLRKIGVDPKDFLLIKEDHESYTFLKRSTGKEFTFRW